MKIKSKTFKTKNYNIKQTTVQKNPTSLIQSPWVERVTISKEKSQLLSLSAGRLEIPDDCSFSLAFL